jgi:hypothetical protein
VKGHTHDISNASADYLANKAEIRVALSALQIKEPAIRYMPLFFGTPVSCDPRHLARRLHNFCYTHQLPVRLQLPIPTDSDTLLTLKIATNGGHLGPAPTFSSLAHSVTRFQLKLLAKMLPTRGLTALWGNSKKNCLSSSDPSCFFCISSGAIILEDTTHFLNCPHTLYLLTLPDSFSLLSEFFYFLRSSYFLPLPQLSELVVNFLTLSPDAMHLTLAGIPPNFLFPFINLFLLNNRYRKKIKKTKKKENKQKQRCLLAGKILFEFSSFFYLHIWRVRCKIINPDDTTASQAPALDENPRLATHIFLNPTATPETPLPESPATLPLARAPPRTDTPPPSSTNPPGANEPVPRVPQILLPPILSATELTLINYTAQTHLLHFHFSITPFDFSSSSTFAIFDHSLPLGWDPRCLT